LTLAFCFACACSPTAGHNGGDGGNNGGDGSINPGADLTMTPPVTITGKVTDTNNGMSMPIANATVSVVGTSTTTTSATDGSFALTVAAGATIFLRSDAASYQSSQRGIVVPAGGGAIGKLEMVSLTQVQQATQGLNPMLALDPTKGDVILNFQTQDTANGYSATLSAAHDMTFTVPQGAPMYSNTTTRDSPLIFPNVVAGTTTIAPSAPAGKSCALTPAITDWRIDGNVFTFVDAVCQ
jgi:hypothetical protein